jgi:hypothetical protein
MCLFALEKATYSYNVFGEYEKTTYIAICILARTITVKTHVR